MVVKSGVERTWLKLRVERTGLKLRVENSGVEMSFNHLLLTLEFGRSEKKIE